MKKFSYRDWTYGDINCLKQRWNDFVAPQSTLSNKLFDKLIELHSEQHRAYHNVGHLIELFEFFDRYKDQFQNPTNVARAIFFHDIIYNPSSKTNEEDSAKFAVEKLALVGIQDDDIERVDQLIILTKTHELDKYDNDAALFLDMDMAVIGQDREKYRRYAYAISLEFQAEAISDLYRQGRSDFLYGLMKKPRIFMTDIFENKFGLIAKSNAAHEVTTLYRSSPMAFNPT